MHRKKEYIKLIEDFLNHILSVQQFERMYLDKFLDDEEPLGEKLYPPLNWLFCEVDAYTDDPTAFLEKDHNYINEEQLREAAAKTLAELQSIKE